MKKIRIGTRGSDLALWQTQWVASFLGNSVELVIIKTSGDIIQDKPLDQVPGVGFFTKEVEKELLDGNIDVAVHSFKDLPTQLTPGLTIAAVPKRGSAHDVIVYAPSKQDPSQRWQLRKHARIGTSSLRRKAQVASLRPDATLVDLRGNVPTRCDKTGDPNSGMDAVVLAAAGLERLGIATSATRVVFPIPLEDVCPAPSQGALAVQCRNDDHATHDVVRHIHDLATAEAVNAERALLAYFGGGCHLPLGVYAQRTDTTFTLRALVAAPDGHERIETIVACPSAEEAVQRAYADLVKKGANKYL